MNQNFDPKKPLDEERRAMQQNLDAFLTQWFTEQFTGDKEDVVSQQRSSIFSMIRNPLSVYGYSQWSLGSAGGRLVVVRRLKVLALTDKMG